MTPPQHPSHPTISSTVATMIRNGATVDNILADIAAEIEKHRTSPPGDEGTPQRDQCKFAIDQHVRTLFPMVVGYVKALVQLDRTLTLLDPQLSFNLSRHLPPAMPISFASPGAFIRSSLPTIGFLGHALLELPAALNFFFNPLAQLLSPEAATETTPLITNPSIGSSALSASAPVVIRQYAVLLFSSILISGLFFARRVDLLSTLDPPTPPLSFLVPLAILYDIVGLLSRRRPY